MGLPLLSAACRLVLSCLLVAASAASLVAQATTRVSVDSLGHEADGGSWLMSFAMSADGRFVAFESEAGNLVADDTNGYSDVFVHDRQTGVTTRVSVDSQGGQANWYCHGAGISADGRFVTFWSEAGNLVPNDTNGREDVFVHDRQTGKTTRESVDSQGNQADFGSHYAAISGDGWVVTFLSSATNLVPGDTNEFADAFVHDRKSGATTRVNVDSTGHQADWGAGGYHPPAISGDGRLVAFWSLSTNLVVGDTNARGDTFVHDSQTGLTTRVNVDSQGNQANYGSYADQAISTNGRFVAFGSSSTNLVAGDTNQQDDCFLHDLQTGETTRVSLDSHGGQANSGSAVPGISADGRFVTFSSVASNLVHGDTNGHADIFVRDRQTGTTTRASLDSQWGEPDSDCGWPSLPGISTDGRFVVFGTDASNLVPGDTNHDWDVFVRDLEAPCGFPASWSNYGSGWPGTNGIPGLVAMSNPVLCAVLPMVADNSLGADTVGVLFAGLSPASLPTVWGGSLLVMPALAIPVPLPAGGLSISATLPCDDTLCGLALFVQVVEVDPGASRGVSFTPGLDLRLGVQ